MPPLFDLTDTVAVSVMAAEGVLLAALIALVGHLFKRMADLESANASTWNARETDAITKRKLGDHIDTLEDHIRADKGPPPPPRPVGI